MDIVQPPVSLLQGAGLFLDLDGTLVELADRPDAVRVEKDLLDLLLCLRQGLGGRLALLSGRSLRDISALLGSPQIAIAASHGLERGFGDRVLSPPVRAPGLPAAIREFRQFEAANHGVLVEEKPAGIALHYRMRPDTESACIDLAEEVAAITGMRLQPGKMVIELKDPSADKGKALREFMNEPPFAGSRPVFIGDDATDEDGFAAALELGGAGVLVGDRRPTSALYRLHDVPSVLDWLRSACGSLS